MLEPAGVKRLRSISDSKETCTQGCGKRLRDDHDGPADTAGPESSTGKSDRGLDSDEWTEKKYLFSDHEEDGESSIDVSVQDQDDEGSDHSEDDIESDEDIDDDDDEFPWLKTISLPIRQSTGPSSSKIGQCVAKLIDREPIRANFHRDMEEPSHDLASLAFDLFDRWGNLKSELYEHPIKKGTGVWGMELNQGRMLLIESIEIDERCRRQGFGRKAFYKYGIKHRTSQDPKMKMKMNS